MKFGLYLKAYHETLHFPCGFGRSLMMLIVVVMVVVMLMMQVSDEFISESSSVVSHLLNENNLVVFTDLILSSVKMLRTCTYFTMLLYFLGRLFDRVNLIKLVSNVHPSVHPSVHAYVRTNVRTYVRPQYLSSISMKFGM